MDYGELARQITTVYLQPLLTGAEGVVIGVMANTIYDVIKRRFIRPAAAGVLAEVEEHPESETNWDALRVQIRKALEEDPSFRDELLPLLPEEMRNLSIAQHAEFTGNGNAVIQNTGANATIKVTQR